MIYTHTSAVIDGDYRYRLVREWSDGPRFVVIGVNPSTADATTDDATIRRCVGFAKAHGCGSLHMVNLFAYRSTDVRKLATMSGWSIIGMDNDTHILASCVSDRAIVVCAWGSVAKLAPGHRLRPALLRRWLREEGIKLHALRLTKHGDPEHPLYLPSELRATPWES